MQIAFTGHRELPEPHRSQLEANIIKLAERTEIDTWHTGAAVGLDTLAFILGDACKISQVLHPPYQYQLNTLRQYKPLTPPLYCELPHCQPIPWDGDKLRFQLRNECMVDRADEVWAYYTGQPGGTRNCIRYALQQNKPVFSLLTGYRITNL